MDSNSIRAFIINWWWIIGALAIFFLIFANSSDQNKNSERIDELNNILTEKENQIKQYDDIIVELDKELASVKGELDNTKDELVQERNHLATVELELKVLAKDHKNETLDYIGEVGKLKKEIQSLKKELNTAKKELALKTSSKKVVTEKPVTSPKPPVTSPGPKFIPYDEPPTPTTPIRPRYPNLAQEAGIEGQVLVQCFIDEKGRVTETIVIKGIPKTGLNEAAVLAIERTRFNPARQRNKPVGVWITIPINFKLQN